MAGLLLAVLVSLFLVPQAEAQNGVDPCADKILAETKANTTLTVDEADRSYPHLKATTEYEIPSAWPGVAALLGRPGDEAYDKALRCFISTWPRDKILQGGEYRQQPPEVRINDASPAANGREAVPPRIVLYDEVIGDLLRTTNPPLLGPWEVTLASDSVRNSARYSAPYYAQFKLITRKNIRSRPEAFDLMTWTAKIQLSSGLRFYQLQPNPVSKDGERQASWSPRIGAKSGDLLASVELDIPTHIAIASDSGWWDGVSYISFALVDAPVYVAILVLLVRRGYFLRALTASNDLTQRRVDLGTLTACLISGFGLVLELFRAAAYWLYGREANFKNRGMPVEYWRFPGLIGIWIVGVSILLPVLMSWCFPSSWGFPRLKKARHIALVLLGVFLIAYGTWVLLSPEKFGLLQDFSPKDKSQPVPIVKTVVPQLVLMTVLTCVALFATLAALHFAVQALRTLCTSTRQQQLADRPVPTWKYLTLSFLMSLVVICQWVWQQRDFWERNNVLPAEKIERNSRLVADVTSGMVTYYLDFLAELAVNTVPWIAILAFVFTLCCIGCGNRKIRPSTWEYRALALICAAVVAGTGTWYVGFTIPVRFIISFVITASIPMWLGQFSQLEKIHVGHSGENKQKRLLDVLPELENPRSLLVTRQVRMDLLRERVRNLDSDLSAGRLEIGGHKAERKKIELLLAEYQLIGIPDDMAQKVVTNGSFKPLKLLRDARPVDGGLAIGPGNDWLENGIRGSRLVMWPSLLATVYFCYIATTGGRFGSFDSYLGTLRLLSYAVRQFGLWMGAAFIFGCLWTTLPGRQGSIKGLVLWVGFAIPYAVDFILRRALHQDPGDKLLLHIILLLSELIIIGLMFDWFMLRNADELRITKWQSLAKLYRVRRLVPILATVVPILGTLIGIYVQLKSGQNVPQPPAVPPASIPK